MHIIWLLALTISSVQAGREVYISCQRDGDIAFTYDQGPSMHTGKLLAVLQKIKAKVSFHVTPDYLDNPILLAYLKKAAAEGHLIGLYVNGRVMDEAHKMTGREGGKSGDEKVIKYVESSRQIIAKHIKLAPTFLRFPNDASPSPNLLNLLWSKGYTVTGYNLDSRDYLFANDTRTGTSGAVFAVFKGIFDAIDPPSRGAFVAVQRDLVASSVEQAEAIIEYARGRGYRAVRLDECVGMSEGGGEEMPEVHPRDVQMEGQSVNAAHPRHPCVHGLLTLFLALTSLCLI